MKQLFEKIAKQEMITFDLNEFERSHPTLLRTIIKAMETVAKNNTCGNFFPDYCSTSRTICVHCGREKFEH